MCRLLQRLLDVLDHLGGILIQHGIMLKDDQAVASLFKDDQAVASLFKDDQAVTSLFEDGHELEGGEASPDLQLREPPMQPAENARVVAYNKENLVTQQV